jgi:hypothetical protein
MEKENVEDKVFYVGLDKDNRVYATKDVDLSVFKTYTPNQGSPWEDGPDWRDNGWNNIIRWNHKA